MKDKYQVIIIGAGPVGLFAAYGLAKKGEGLFVAGDGEPEFLAILWEPAATGIIVARGILA